jgi:hypothetical protein
MAWHFARLSLFVLGFLFAYEPLGHRKVMEDQTSWKGHTFTLVVFTGIVVLCSIFFILGMLVGRAQAQKLVSNGPAGGSAKNGSDGSAHPAAMTL